MSQVRADMAKAVKQLQDEAKAAAEKHASELQKLEAALQKEREEHSGTRQKVSELEVSLRISRESIATLEERQRLAEQEHKEALQRQEEDFDREKRNLKEQHKRGLEQLLETHLKETDELKEQFERARHLQDMQIQMLQQRCQELQDLYDSRPSREEDLERIAQLENELDERTAQVKKLMDDMQFYKLELTNRENNYNKVFGAAPNIGIMNPVAAKKGPGGGAPQMRVVQQPGAGMGGLNMSPAGGGVPPAGPGSGGGGKRQTMVAQSTQRRPNSETTRRGSALE